MRIITTILALDPLLENSNQNLVAEVALGGLSVSVQDECVGDLQPVSHLHVHPGGATVNV